MRTWRTLLVCILCAGGAAVVQPGQAAEVDINNKDRESVARAYVSWLLPTFSVPVGFTGDATACKPGLTSSASKRATLSALNFMRAMVDLPPVVERASLSTLAQASSLIMEANGFLTHYPSRNSRCYSTAGYKGASTGNLHIAQVNDEARLMAPGARAVTSYMVDDGDNNTSVGHRRWLLYPPLLEVGIGDTGIANTIVVLGGKWRSTKPKAQWITWPSAGYFPWELEPLGRWSVTYPQADFRGAKVTARIGSTSLPVQINPIDNGAGDNTLTFEVSLPKTRNDSKVDVSIAGIKVNKKSLTRTYSVTLFDVDPNDEESARALEPAAEEPEREPDPATIGFVKPTASFVARSCKRERDGWKVTVDTIFTKGRYSAMHWETFSGPKDLQDSWTVRRDLYLASLRIPTGTVRIEQAGDMMLFLAMDESGSVIGQYNWPDSIAVKVTGLCR